MLPNTGSDGSRIRVRLDDEKRSKLYHPTWCMEYLTGEAGA